MGQIPLFVNRLDDEDEDQMILRYHSSSSVSSHFHYLEATGICMTNSIRLGDDQLRLFAK